MKNMKNYPMLLLARCTLAKSLIIALLLACALGEWATPLGATDRHWTGATSANINADRWSDGFNWDPVGVPQNGETLIFDHAQNTTMVNDLVDLTVADLVFTGVGGLLVAADFNLSGDPLTITNSITQHT